MLTTKNSGALVEHQGAGTEEKMATVKIKMTRNTFIAGELAAAGQTVSVGEKEALSLIKMGKAVPAGTQTKADDKESSGK